MYNSTYNVLSINFYIRTSYIELCWINTYIKWSTSNDNTTKNLLTSERSFVQSMSKIKRLFISGKYYDLGLLPPPPQPPCHFKSSLLIAAAQRKFQLLFPLFIVARLCESWALSTVPYILLPHWGRLWLRSETNFFFWK